jgi:hypothetical protein
MFHSPSAGSRLLNSTRKSSALNVRPFRGPSFQSSTRPLPTPHVTIGLPWPLTPVLPRALLFHRKYVSSFRAAVRTARLWPAYTNSKLRSFAAGPPGLGISSPSGDLRCDPDKQQLKPRKKGTDLRISCQDSNQPPGLVLRRRPTFRSYVATKQIFRFWVGRMSRCTKHVTGWGNGRNI